MKALAIGFLVMMAGVAPAGATPAPTRLAETTSAETAEIRQDTRDSAAETRVPQERPIEQRPAVRVILRSPYGQ